MAEVKLGDTIEDWCPRCRLLLDHNVAAIVGGDVKKVVCNTCFSEHPYRHAQGKRKDGNVKDLFEQVLGGRITGGGPVGPAKDHPRKRRPQ